MYIPNWSGLTNVKRIEKHDNTFVHQQGLEGKFVVQYSGNIGYTHNVEVLVEIAREMEDYDDVFFMIIGRGEKFQTIKSLVESYGLRNCRLLPFQPDDILNYTLSAADLGVVLLDDRTAHVSVPSKIYNLQAVGVPILGIADTNSELGHHLAKHRNGRCFHANDRRSIIEFIVKLKTDRSCYLKLRENSRITAEQYVNANASKYVENYLLWDRQACI